VLAPIEWSPRGDELLYASYALPFLGPADDPCPRIPAPGTVRWFVLPLSGVAAEPVADVSALLRQWWGDRAVEIGCEDGSDPGPFRLCGGGDRVLYVGGKRVASGDVSPLGFLDTP